MECFGREYKAGWAVEEKKDAKRILDSLKEIN
jgi:hypothetical protein